MSNGVIDLIYQKVTDVLGGSNPQQLFTLMMPGTLVNAADFGDSVPLATRRIRETVLANSLLDVAHISATSNARLLPDVYGSALSQLIPTLNEDLQKMRAALRKALDQPMEGRKESRLEYLNVKLKEYQEAVDAWSTEQDAQLRQLKIEFPDAPSKQQNAFDEWYASHSAQPEARIRNAYTNMSAVLSTQERGWIEAILNAGEDLLGSSRNALREARRHYPEGDAYVVNFTPSDWTSLLTSSFGYVDMLDSPEHLAAKLALAQGVIQQQMDNLDVLSSELPTQDEVKAAREAARSARTAFQTAQEAVLNVYADSAATAAKIYLSKQKGLPDDDKTKSTKDVNDLKDALAKGKKKSEPPSDKKGGGGPLSPEDVEKLLEAQKALIGAQSTLQQATEAYSKSALTAISTEARYANLAPIYQKLRSASQRVAELQAQLDSASRVPGDLVSRLFPDEESERFTQVSIQFTGEKLESESKLTSRVSATDWTASLLVASAGGADSDGTSEFQNSVKSAKTEFNIGMLVAKVGVDRTWFKPHVFQATRDMKRITEQKISIGSVNPEDKDKINATLFPAFPTAFVIAKDVTIQIKLEEGQTAQAQKAMDRQRSSGGGFLCFSVSRSSGEHADEKSFSSYAQGTQVTIRIPGAQILGWYQQAVPADESTVLTSHDVEVALEVFLQQFQSVRLKSPEKTRTFRKMM